MLDINPDYSDIWDAINEYASACGGDTGDGPLQSRSARMTASAKIGALLAKYGLVYRIPAMADDHDLVNRPPHYTSGDVECIDAIQSALTEEEFRGYCKGAAMKYIWRERMKGGEEDLRKAMWYLRRLDQTRLRRDHV